MFLCDLCVLNFKMYIILKHTAEIVYNNKGAKPN